VRVTGTGRPLGPRGRGMPMLVVFVVVPRRAWIHGALRAAVYGWTDSRTAAPMRFASIPSAALVMVMD
jgi:hypothetical protein